MVGRIFKCNVVLQSLLSVDRGHAKNCITGGDCYMNQTVDQMKAVGKKYAEGTDLYEGESKGCDRIACLGL